VWSAVVASFVGAALLVTPSRSGSAQAQRSGSTAAAGDTVPLYTAVLGPFSRPVTTDSVAAQSYFDQGMQLMFAFTPDDATQSFREASRRDPTCAMCYWGEAWSLGSYLNGRMASEDAPPAHAAVLRAQELASRGSPVERGLIKAMAVRYEPTHNATRRAALDSAYADAMRDVWTRFPDDLDAGTLYAEALMLLEPRRGTWDVERPSVARIHEVLEAVLAKDLTHPGACHLFIHATESTALPEKAERCADHLGSAIPGASHINHMPSHTYNRVGRWGDAVRANIQAYHSDQKAAIGEGVAIYPTHNLHMLLFAASMDGQGAIAIQAGKDYAKITGGTGIFYHVLALVRFGRFDEVLDLRAAPRPPIQHGLWAFGRGYAHLRLDATDSARAYLAVVDSIAANAGDSVAFRGHTAASLLGVTGGILRAELLVADGDRDHAIATLEQAVALEDRLRYDEPEPLNFSARHWLGALLLEAGRPAGAEQVYRTALEDHPHNGWSLLGLAQALAAQGRAGEAVEAREAFERAWARSDTWIRASRF
jgi:tetratricopeptide (TPR) repeat protein